MRKQIELGLLFLTSLFVILNMALLPQYYPQVFQQRQEDPRQRRAEKQKPTTTNLKVKAKDKGTQQHQVANLLQHLEINDFLLNLSAGGDNYTTCDHAELHLFKDTIRVQRQQRSKMPHILHINSKTKCVTDHIENFIRSWRMPDYSIFLHDNQEMENLFNMDTVVGTFPSLKNATRCLPYQGSSSSASKNDLFRFLLLYYVGGVYTEFDLRPTPLGHFPDAVELFEDQLVSSEIRLLEEGGALEGGINAGAGGMLLLKRNGHPFLGTMFFTPQHPLLYICVNLVVRNLLRLLDVSQQRAFGLTGPPILHEALQIFTGLHKEQDEGWEKGRVYAMSPGIMEMYPYLARYHNNGGGNYTIYIPEQESFYDYVYETDSNMLYQKQHYYGLAGLKHWQRNDKGVHEFNRSCVEYNEHVARHHLLNDKATKP